MVLNHTPIHVSHMADIFSATAVATYRGRDDDIHLSFTEGGLTRHARAWGGARPCCLCNQDQIFIMWPCQPLRAERAN